MGSCLGAMVARPGETARRVVSNINGVVAIVVQTRPKIGRFLFFEQAFVVLKTLMHSSMQIKVNTVVALTLNSLPKTAIIRRSLSGCER